MEDILLRIAAFFRDESCGQCVPCRVGTVRQEEALHRITRGKTAGRGEGRARVARRDRRRHEGRVDLRPRADGVQRGRIGGQAAGTVRRGGRPMTALVRLEPAAAHRSSSRSTARRSVRRRRVDDPRRLPAARPGDPHPLLPRHPAPGERVPRLRGGSRGIAGAGAVLLPEGRGGHGREDRHASGCGTAGRWCSSFWRRRSISRPRRTWPGGWPTTAAEPERYGPPARRGGGRRTRPGRDITRLRTRDHRATVGQPVKVDNDLYMRDYAKCILCYKCVEACGTDWQNTFAHRRSRGGGSTPGSRPSSRWSYPSRRACTAATASRSALPAR